MSSEGGERMCPPHVPHVSRQRANGPVILCRQKAHSSGSYKQTVPIICTHVRTLNPKTLNPKYRHKL